MSESTWEIITTLKKDQIAELCQMYQQEWWSKGRQLADIRKMLAHSDLIIALCHSQTHQLMAFARIITDFVYRGLILDVIVASEYRGQGLGKTLLDTITRHPQLQTVETLILFCHPEMVSFYQKWGFTEGKEDIRLMFGKKVLESR